jgi:hypothetical protein
MLSPEDLSQSWRVEAPILCVAGRGRFDGAAANMLAQLLARHGLGARSVGNEAVSRANIGSLDGREVALICVCSLAIGWPLSHLRYLRRRLRQRFHDIPLLVGFWREGDPDPQSPDARIVVGADHYAGSLREAVLMCLREAGAAAVAPSEPGDGCTSDQLPASATEERLREVPSESGNESGRLRVDTA